MKDDAAIKFTQEFYGDIFKGFQVCDAFYNAKQSIRTNFTDNDANMFQILLQDEDKEHQCCNFMKVKDGMF